MKKIKIHFYKYLKINTKFGISVMEPEPIKYSNNTIQLRDFLSILY